MNKERLYKVLLSPRVTEKSARIGEEYDVTSSGETLELMEEAHAVLSVGATVNLQNGWVFSTRFEARRFHDPHMNLRAVGRLDPMRRYTGSLYTIS